MQQTLCAAVAILGAVTPLFAAPSDETLKTFTLTERFGVSHPEQIIDFDIDSAVDAGSAYLLGPDGIEVSCQLLPGGRRLAVRTDLPAGAKKRWTLMSGRAPSPKFEGVKVAETDAWYEITNGLTGVRIAKPAQTAANSWKPLVDLSGSEPQTPRAFVPAPVQGVQYRDGQWSGLGPNGLAALATEFHGMEVVFRQRGPLKVVVEVAYRFSRPAITSGDKTALADGPARYVSTIEVQAGQPSILFAEEADTDVTYSLNLYSGLRPTKARYQGHHATLPEYGYVPDGKVYGNWNQRSFFDAQVDLRYDRPMLADSKRTADTWPRMAVWNPWIYDGGWYWQFFDAGAPATANLVGIFAGRASWALGAANSGTGLFTLPAAQKGADPRAGLTIALYGRRPPARIVPQSRYQWGLFLGVKGADLAPAEAVQPIARQMNLHGGINLNKLHRLQVDYPDPAAGYGSFYIDAAVVRRMIQRIRQDKEYYRLLHGGTHASGAQQQLVDFWADTTGRKPREGLKNLCDSTAKTLNLLVHGNGILDKSMHYWEGGSAWLGNILWADQLLATGQLSAEEAATVKAIAVLLATLLLDDDHTPLGAAHGLNLGNANMPLQHNAMRAQAALFLAHHPMMKQRLGHIWPAAQDEIRASINQHGAHWSAVGYITTSQPLMATLLALQNQGVVDPFRDETRLAKFAEFYMNLMTPPECRFGNPRKLLPIGDSSTCGDAVMGQLATGMARSNPALSARLMGAWRAMGCTHGTFYGSTLLSINQELPATQPVLGDAAFPGYYSVLRYGCNSPAETAAWCVSGNFYGDHAHNDLGELILYALGAPLSVDWSGRYPSTKAGIYHSTVIEEKAFGHPWDREDFVDPYDPSASGGAGISGHSGYVPPATASHEELLSFRSAGRTVSRFEYQGLVWHRTVTMLRANEDYPAILVADRFSGKGADQPKIFTLNLMADGPVSTPAGEMAPPRRSYDNPLAREGHKRKQSPSAGPVFALKPGVNRLGFTGQAWPKHPAQGIDWDLFLINAEDQQAHLGNWANSWQPAGEQGEFKAANGRPYEERQHILRVRGTGAFTALILPYRKGAKRADLRVEQEGANLRVSAGKETTFVGEGSYAHSAPGTQILAAFTGQPAELAGLRIEGGPAEVTVTTSAATIVLHGPKGRRSVRVPGGWQAEKGKRSACPIELSADQVAVDYAGHDPAIVTLVRRGPQ